MMRKKKINKKPGTKVYAYRCTLEEHDRIKALAKVCGLSINRYMVETAVNHHPRQRLTKVEVDALNSLTLARADLINISNVLRKKTDEEKAKYFKSEKFMRWWIDAVAGLIQHWYSIEENITSSVQTKSKESS
ncbi:hypothetical protein FH717_22480 [Bacteroides thetaiotaomicron]|nr:hypothetical protein [Bacteroides thetaiotaomicron]MBL3939989.1 hypothetical protein [Bacteroides thetaiotaomicron]RGX36180.1 hypothetical protein DWV24_23145 [Bacteroides thetaiotaomicron]